MIDLARVRSFVRRRPRELFIAFLVMVTAVLAFQRKCDQRQIQELSTQIGHLPPGTKQIVTVYRDRVVTQTQIVPGKIEYRDRYVPPEGHVSVYIGKDDAETGADLEVKDWGFTCRLGGGMVYSGKVLPVADLKWFYLRRYSLLTGITPQFWTLAASRHIDDFTPFANLEILGGASLSWQGDLRLAAGLRTNF